MGEGVLTEVVCGHFSGVSRRVLFRVIRVIAVQVDIDLSKLARIT